MISPTTPANFSDHPVVSTVLTNTILPTFCSKSFYPHYNVLVGLNKTDIMKIDVEGAELLVLNGGKKILEEFKPMLILEFSDENYTGEFGVSTTDLIVLLKELNNVVFVIKEGGLEKWDERTKYPSWYNVACIHETKLTNL